jgi:hypothetical protein
MASITLPATDAMASFRLDPSRKGAFQQTPGVQPSLDHPTAQFDRTDIAVSLEFPEVIQQGCNGFYRAA